MWWFLLGFATGLIAGIWFYLLFDQWLDGTLGRH